MKSSRVYDPREYLGVHGWIHGRYKHINSPPREPSELYKGTGKIIFDYKPEVLEHLKLFDTSLGNHYFKDEQQINSLIFVRHDDNCTDEQATEIQKIIDLAYFTNSNNPQYDYPSAKFQLANRMVKRGISLEYAETSLRNHIDNATEFLENNKDKLNEIQINALNMVINRTCDKMHDNALSFGSIPEPDDRKNLLFQNLLIEENKKQLLFLNLPYDKPYKDHDKIITQPFIQFDTFLGDYIWSLHYNKFLTRCSITYDNDMLFPLRFMLCKQLNHLFFNNVLLDNPTLKYMGFYLIRYNNDKTVITNIKEECKSTYNFEIKLPESSHDQYYVMFVFEQTSKLQSWVKYLTVNYKGNRVNWGNIGDAPIVLYVELLQTMCMNTSNEAFFYIILKKDITSFDCKTIKDDFNSNMFCVEASYEIAFYNALVTNNISPFSVENNEYIIKSKKEFRNEIQLLVSRNNKDYVFEKFKERLTNNSFSYEDKKLNVNSNDYDYIEFEEYIFMQVHLDWKNDPKDRLVILPGDMSNERKVELKTKICIPSDCGQELDYRRRIYQALLNKPGDIPGPITDQVLSQLPEDLKIKLFGVPEKHHDETLQLKGGTRYFIKEIEKFEKIYKEYKELDNKYNLTNIKQVYLTNGVKNNFTNLTLNTVKKNIYKEGKKIRIIENVITPTDNIYYILSIFPHIILKNILIITSNTNILEGLLFLNNNYIKKITIIILNSIMIAEFYLLKKKFKDLLEIYYIGNRYDYNSYETICNIIKDNKYNSIIIDYSRSNSQKLGNELSTTISILLINKYLNLEEKYNCYILYNILPTENNFLLWLYNLAYNHFYNHNLNDQYNSKFTVSKQNTLYIYNNLKETISKEKEEILINFLKTEEIPSNIKYNYSDNFLNNIIMRWNKIILTHSENLERLKNILLTKSKRLNYHRNVNFSTIYKTIPETIYNIPNNYTYNDDALDHQTKCHWGQKKLLLSEIQFFTRICETLQIKSLEEYAVVYIGSAGGHHLPILYNLFPDLIWLLYDPAPYSDVVMKHQNKDKSVFVYNMFFTDKTLEHVKKNSQGRKILFISDIRVENKEENIIKDMRDQAFWGMELNAPYMLLKFRLPYEELDSIPKSNKQLNLNEKYISNPNFITNKKNNMIYLKGDVYLQIFPPPYSGELRLFVEQKDNKYEFVEYDYLDIENRLINFNSVIRPTYGNIESDDLEMLNYIPGYDTSIECLMEYQVVQKFYKYFFNITDSKILIHKLYDMNFFLEKLTHRNFITCNYDTTNKNLNKTKNNEDKIVKLKYWKEISKLNIGLSAKNQYELIKKNGLSILGEKRYNRALEYLQKYITDLKYVEI